MSVAACADLVRRGDPDRFRAVMAAPIWARERLLPLYALNLEVARAPWVTKEPLIAEMRLQWWRDALDEIGAAGPIRRHEVVTPLAEVLDTDAVALLGRMVEARRADIGHGPADAAGQAEYLAETGGTLMQVAGRVLGAGAADAPALAEVGFALATANWLRAYPALIAAGKRPWCDPGTGALQALAAAGLARLGAAGPLTREGRIAALAAWQARPVLRKAVASEAAITEARLDPGPLAASLRLLWASLRA